MFITSQDANNKGFLRVLVSGMAIGSAALVMAVATPAAAKHNHITIEGISFGDDDEDLLEQLIELDADDIQELREEMAEARVEIMDAIGEIEEAREEVKSVPGGGAIMKAALMVASSTIKESTEEAFEELRSELAIAEMELADRDDISAEERTETQLAIDVLREEMASLELALGELADAMRA